MKIILFILASFAMVQTAAAESFVGRVVGVADGDTVTVLVSGNQQKKVRLAGIDAPEKAQDFGQASKRSLSDLIYNQAVMVDEEGVDQYGRSIGWIYKGDMLVNLTQIERGMAWVYRRYVDIREQPGVELDRAEAVAKRAREGLWVDEQPTPPWEFRKESKKKGQ